MDLTLLKPEIQEFINSNLAVDISKLALKKNPFPDANWIEVLNQISAKKKVKDKLPTFFNTPNIIYPSKTSVEQTSSEQTALYKSTLVSGDSLIDLTGGFGVDDYYFSKKMKLVIHCEINLELSEIVIHNFKLLAVNNIQCFTGDSEVILKNLSQKLSWIYIDPSRRNDVKGKVFMLKDCLPNVPDLLNFYFKFSENLLIKTAPILDISAGLSELQHVKSIHIVAVENEVKELLWEISKDYLGKIQIKTVNILKDKKSIFNFILNETTDNLNYSLPKKYLFEPNSAIMKSGGFDFVSSEFNLGKLHPHSHLYTYDEIIDFPGRIFKIEKAMSYIKSDMKQYLENQSANITIRNFPDSVENIRKKWKIKDGGNRYCFFTTDLNNNKIVLICAKITKS